MRAIVQKCVRALCGRKAAEASSTPARHTAPLTPANPENGTLARHLARAIDRALSLRLYEHAERLAASAAPLAPSHAPLTERLARLRMMQGDAETSLRIIEAYRERPSSLRLLHAVCLIQLGRGIEAHIDLHEWCGKASAPLDARVLLALLEWEHGDYAAAIDAVQRNLKHLEDPRSLQVLLLMSIMRDRPAQAAQWADRLREAGLAALAVPDIDLLLSSLNLPPAKSHASHPSQIAALALELSASEQVIPALVEALRRRPNPGDARRLYLAMECAWADLTDRAAASEALARLALLLNDHNAASAWVERGLAINPMSAKLAMLAREVAAAALPSTADELVETAESMNSTDESAGLSRTWGEAA